MKRNQLSSSLFLLATAAAAVTGCAADAPGTGDPVDPTDPTDPNQPVPTTVDGKYAVNSTFDLATSATGTAGTVVRYFIDATDNADDPTRFILEQLINQVDDQDIKAQLQSYTNFVAGYLNDKLLAAAPGWVTKFKDLGNAFGDIVKNFGVMETYDIATSGATIKTVTGVKFKVNAVDFEFPFADSGIQEIKLTGLQVGLEPTGKLTISRHTVPMKYGALLKLALEQAIIPMLDPTATTLAEYLQNLVNCASVGIYIEEALNQYNVTFDSASTYETACNFALVAAQNLLYNKLNQMDNASLEFNLTGTARAVDKNRDGKMDDFVTGVWTGDLAWSGEVAPLSTATFFGKRQ